MIKLITEIVRTLEEEWGCIIEVDFAVLDEAKMMAETTIEHITIRQPNALKQGGHYAFWMRKLKPFRVVNLSAFQEFASQLIEGNFVKGNIETVQSVLPEPKHCFINEICAILCAIGIVERRGYKVSITKTQLHDFAATLRYHSFSPSAITATLSAYVQLTQLRLAHAGA